MANVTCVLSHKRPAWPDLIWLHRKEHGGWLYDAASTKRGHAHAGLLGPRLISFHNGAYAARQAFSRDAASCSWIHPCAALSSEHLADISRMQRFVRKPMQCKRWITTDYSSA